MSIAPFYRDTPGPYSALLQKRDRGEPVSREELGRAREGIVNGGLTNPFLYQIVRNEDGLMVGHLVGSMHSCNQPILEHPGIQAAVLKCNRFFIERLPSWYATTPPERCAGASVISLESESSLAGLGMAYRMDSSLCLLARSKNIDCEGLETAEESQRRVELISNSNSRIIQDVLKGTFHRVPRDVVDVQAWFVKGELGPALPRDYVNRDRHSQEELYLESIECYQRGSAQQLHSFMVHTSDNLQEIVFKPNVLWAARSILPALSQVKREDQSVCVVVGTNHLLGLPSAPEETSLIKILRERGFSVTRISSPAQT